MVGSSRNRYFWRMEQRSCKVAAHALAQAELSDRYVQEFRQLKGSDEMVQGILVFPCGDFIDVPQEAQMIR